jgi:hypothetical protein
VRLGLALDGVNPFGDLNSCHSTQLVVLLNYNLPPWLVIKKYFLMLTLIIPSKESCTSINVDAYLNAKFNLKAMCIQNIHDFSTYGLFVGCVIKGHMGCPLCGPTIDSKSSKKLKKMVFCGTCKYLPKSHPYR